MTSNVFYGFKKKKRLFLVILYNFIEVLEVTTVSSVVSEKVLQCINICFLRNFVQTTTVAMKPVQVSLPPSQFHAEEQLAIDGLHLAVEEEVLLVTSLSN